MARIGELLGPNQEVIHPQTSASVVYLEDGRSVEQVLSDDIDYGNVVFQESSYKFSSDVEDDFAKTVVIKGQTYQNILPEPSTPILSNHKEMFKVNDGLDSNVEIVDGVSKSAILKGNTLVNLCDDGVADASDIKRFTHNYTSNGGTFEQVSDGIKATTTQDNTWLIVGYDIRSQQKKMMTIGKKYYGVADVTVHKLTNSDSCSIAFRSQYSLRQSATLTRGRGIVQGVFNHGGVDANHGWLSVGTNTQKAVVGDSFTIHSMSVYEITEEEVNLSYEELANKYPVKCVGMQSAKMPVLTTVGKNLSPINDYETTVWEYVKGYQGFNKVLAKNILVNENKEYRLSFTKECEDGLPTNLGNIMVQFSSIPVSSNIDDHNSVYTHCQNNKGKKYAHITMPNIGQGNEYVGKRVTLTNIQLEVGSVATTYEPYKTNTLHTPEEVVLRSLPNGVCDTLNLNTGEYVQRIGEVVLEGTQNWTLKTGNWEFENTFGFVTTISDMINTTQSHPAHSNGNSLVCSHFPSYGGNSLSNNALPNDIEMIGIDLNRLLGLRITKTKLSTPNAEGLKTWLRDNPVTVQYELATPIIKTLDLSSSGNWEKVVLDGSENWTTGDDNLSSVYRNYVFLPNNIHGVNLPCFVNDSNFPNIVYGENKQGVVYGAGNRAFYVFSDKKKYPTLESFKKYLQQNPMTVWYQTKSNLDSTQVKQPIFFKDGHIIQSSGADHSLVPTLDYQAKTSNSYVMDLMKTNTHYTMKAKSASGTFTIDGTSYNVGTNTTFTSPSSMTNKFLVMSNKTNEEVMILEGDVVSKAIPYFKGIKSAFEDESKIEVLSCGKNLFDFNIATAHGGVKNKDSFSFNNIANIDNNRVKVDSLPHLIEDKTYTLSCLVTNKHSTSININSGYGINGTTWVLMGSVGVGETKRVSMTFIANSDKYGRRLLLGSTTAGSSYTVSQIQIEESSSATSYKPYKSNNTKIPLLSPLRSLPNGVCDELIIDRMKKKATLIQRVGYNTLGREGHDYYHVDSSIDTKLYQPWYTKDLGNKVANVNDISMWSDKFLVEKTHYPSKKGNSIHQYSDNSANFVGCTLKSVLGGKSVRKWFEANEVSVYYQLATPTITEIDLEGFPFIYREGHIFLNGEIAPTVGIEYGINQGHRIEGQVETLQRHEKQFTQLERYFADLVHSDYNFALLRFSEKLRQQEGDV